MPYGQDLNLLFDYTIIEVIDINKLIGDSLDNNQDTHDIIANTLSFPLKQARENFEKDYLISQLKRHQGNISKTAEFVGMERSALHRKLKNLGIKGLN